MSQKLTSLFLLSALSSLTACGDPKVKERSLERERDSARTELETEKEQNDYDREFAARYQDYLKSHNRAMAAANRYLKTGNGLLADDM